MQVMVVTQQRLRIAVVGLSLALLGLFVAHNWTAAKASITLLSGVSWMTVATCSLLVLGMFCCAAGAYVFLALRPIRFTLALVIEFAANAVNKLIPSGLGGLGVHGVFLRKQKHSVAQATAIAGLNNLLGAMVHCLLLLCVIVFARSAFEGFHLGITNNKRWILPGIGTGAVVIVLFFLRQMTAFRRFVKKVITALQTIKQRPLAVMATSFCLLSIPLLQTGVLALLAQHLAIELSVVQLFVALSTGILLGAVIPTPGGLGGVEAGIVATCGGFGIDLPHAMAIALAFRALTYWAPLLPGFMALMWVQQRKLI